MRPQGKTLGCSSSVTITRPLSPFELRTYYWENQVKGRPGTHTGHHAAGFLRAVRLQSFDVPNAWHTGRATVPKKVSIFASERSRTAIRSPPRTYNAPQTHHTAAAHCFSTYITDTRGLGVCTVGGSCRTLARTPIRSDHRRRSTASQAVHLHPANAEPSLRAPVDFQAAVVTFKLAIGGALERWRHQAPIASSMPA